MKLTFDIKYGGKSYGTDFRAAMYKAAEDQIKKNLTQRLRNVQGLENEAVTIHVDMKDGKVTFSDISSPEALESIQEALGQM